MLIVNADDWGSSPRTTDAILAAFDRGDVSSTSAMVFMHGSAYGAAVARERRLPVGLHLNLTLPFEAPDVPPAVQERQRILTGILSGSSWMEPPELSVLRPLLAEAVRDQLDRFREEIGEPTHLDGHHHVHIIDDVLAVLPPHLPLRGVPRPPSRLHEPGSARDAFLHRHHTVPDVTLSLDDLHPALGGTGLEPLERAQHQMVEVIAHPGAPGHSEALASAQWRAALASLVVGSYADLR